MPSPTFGFGSDNHATIHEEVLQSITAFNQGHAPSYGSDALTAGVKELMQQHFGPKAQVFFVFNGTAANVLCLRALLDSHEAVITAESSHMAQDECGAPEFHGSNKVLTVPTLDGKLTPELIAPLLVRLGDQHTVQPRMVSLTMPTELGTVYSLDELKKLREFTRKHNLFLHIDGARLGNAACALDVGFKQITSDIEVDAVSLGGTKNGLLGAEAVIFFDQRRCERFKYIHKQEMQLPSKTRFLAAQFHAYFNNDLWLRIAQHSLRLAKELKIELERFNKVKILYPVQSNAVFAKFPREWVKPLRETCFFYIWDETTWVTRLMLSHDNTSQDIKRFVGRLEELQKG